MPQHKSCEKRMRTSSKARSRNRLYRSRMKRAVRDVREAKSPEDAQNALKVAGRLLDRLARKGIIHKNRAADRKSRLHRVVKSMQG